MVAKTTYKPPWWMTPNGKLGLKCFTVALTLAGYVGIAGIPFLAFNTIQQENAIMPGNVLMNLLRRVRPTTLIVGLWQARR